MVLVTRLCRTFFPISSINEVVGADLVQVLESSQRPEPLRTPRKSSCASFPKTPPSRSPRSSSLTASPTIELRALPFHFLSFSLLTQTSRRLSQEIKGLANHEQGGRCRRRGPTCLFTSPVSTGSGASLASPHSLGFSPRGQSVRIASRSHVRLRTRSG